MRTIGGYHKNIPPSPIKNVTLLGSNTKVDWEVTTDSFYLTMPEVEFNSKATVFKFELE